MICLSVCLSIQAKELLDMTADELAELKEGPNSDADAFKAALTRSQWSQWVMRVQTRSRWAAVPGSWSVRVSW
jgi:hypothetical protein